MMRALLEGLGPSAAAEDNRAGKKRRAVKFTALTLPPAERKAMNLEIQRQLAEYSRKHANEIDAIIL